jgi:hypothetical protein
MFEFSINFSPPFFEFLIALALFLFQAFSALSMLIHLISIFLFPFFLFPFIASLVIFFLPKVFLPIKFHLTKAEF